ncbi:MAG TPA: hypothetical protein DEQ09_07385 [Bacteroidales bacterium]|nr:hypothetical protein [Bacteroidales bacterium]
METKKILSVLLLILFLSGCNNQRSGNKNIDLKEGEPVYDSVLAKKLGADPYGMKQYVMAFLLRGDKSSADSTEAAILQKAHMDNITRLAEMGKLILAGPFLDEGDLSGIYIFNVSSIEEAEKLTASDPAIRAGVLKIELHTWYGSAALQKLNELHATIQSDRITI